MAEYDNTNRGVLYKNDRRENDKQPNFKGRINIDGTEYWLSGWSAKKEDGETYVRLARGDVRVPTANGASMTKPAPRRASASLDDDMPF
jgi:hypothetical protein